MIYKAIDIWDCFALHIWLILSSYGIMFAILSFFEDVGCLDKIKKYPSLKGIIAFFAGIIFYIVIGLRHLEGGKKDIKKILN